MGDVRERAFFADSYTHEVEIRARYALKEQLKFALQALSQKQREVFIWVYFEQMTLRKQQKHCRLHKAQPKVIYIVHWCSYEPTCRKSGRQFKNELR